jgi:hypothetical protein
MELMMLKTPTGSLVPMDDEQADAMKRIRPGSVIKCNVTEMRNGPFFRKWWTLAKMAFDLSSERMTPREHKGKQVLPSFDAFRKDLTILAGYYEATYKYDGTVRLQAQSLQWSKMDEETFEKLYSASIDAVLQKILPGMNEVDLKRAIDQTLAYA